MGDRSIVGFGGGHYVPRFERVVRETAWTVGHVAADWSLDAMGDPARHREVLVEAFEASDATHALVDGTYPDLEAVVEDLGYRVVSETWLREVEDRDLDAVAAIEAALSSVDDGLRFGDRSLHASDRSEQRAGFASTDAGDTGGGDTWAVRDLPDDLLAAARSTDEAATRSAVEAATVAFETQNGGSQAAGRAAFPAATDAAETGTADAGADDAEAAVGGADQASSAGDPTAAYDELVDGLVAVLTARYDDVEREGDRVVGRVDAFDPELAAAAGVPEGPKFGTLANGEAVTVEGETIDPADVHATKTDVYDI